MGQTVPLASFDLKISSDEASIGFPQAVTCQNS